MIDAIYDSGSGQVQHLNDMDTIKALIERGDGTMWVRLHGNAAEIQQHILGDMFKFHPLAVEDVLSRGYQAPKVDDFGSYLFVIVHAATYNGDVINLETTELNFFLGTNYLVSACHDTQIVPVERVWERIERDKRILEHGPDWLLHTLLDAVVDEFMPLLDHIDDEVDALEDQIILQPDPRALRRILDLKHSILALRRVVSPQREVMLRLSRGEFDLIDESSRIYFRDIYDHLVRINDISEGVRDVVAGTLDTYLSVSSNKLNEVMKALTIVSTIFLPLTLITSLYGMNFDFMPELHWHYGYLMIWVIMGVITVGMLWFFRRRRWL